MHPDHGHLGRVPQPDQRDADHRGAARLLGLALTELGLRETDDGFWGRGTGNGEEEGRADHGGFGHTHTRRAHTGEISSLTLIGGASGGIYRSGVHRRNPRIILSELTSNVYKSFVLCIVGHKPLWAN